MFTPDQKEVAQKVVETFFELEITARNQAKFLRHSYETGDYEYFDTFNEYLLAFIDALAEAQAR